MWSGVKVDAIGAGKRYGRYHIIATLQRGGMGEVVLADIDEEGKKSRVVLKRLLADLLEDEKYVAMFLVEAQVMSRLNHPNIVKVFDVPVIDGKQCLAMEYVEGVNVYQVLKRCRTISAQIPPQVALYIALEMLKGLEYAHGFVLDDGRPLELVHRDVTPGNVLLSFQGDVKITDFGIAKSKMSNLSTTVGVVKGTTRYLSPEQIRGEPATHRSDLFSCASVLVELLTGVPLFDRGSVPPTLFAIASGERPEISKLLPFQAPRLAAALERALSVRPELRYPSAKAFHDELVEASGELGPLMDRSGVSAFLRELFPERQETAPDLEIEGHVPGVDPMNLTYLFEMRDPIAWGSEKGELPTVSSIPEPKAFEPIKSMITGSQPLDAELFDDRASRSDRTLTPQARRLRNVVEIHVHGNLEASPPVAAAPRAPTSSSTPALSPARSRPGVDLTPVPDARSRSLSEVLVVPVPSRTPFGSDVVVRPRAGSDASGASLAAVPAPVLPAPGAGVGRTPSSISSLPLIPPEANVADIVPPGHGLTPADNSGIHAVRVPKPAGSRFLLFLLGVVAGVLCMRFLDVAESDQLVVKREPHAIVAVVAAPEAATAPSEAAGERTIEPIQIADIASPAAAPRADARPEARAEGVRSVEVPREAPREGGLLDIRRPRGARVMIDGAVLTKKVPIIGWRLTRGAHKLVLVKGATKKIYTFEVTDGDRVDVSRLEAK